VLDPRKNVRVSPLLRGDQRDCFQLDLTSARPMQVAAVAGQAATPWDAHSAPRTLIENHLSRLVALASIIVGPHRILTEVPHGLLPGRPMARPAPPDAIDSQEVRIFVQESPFQLLWIIEHQDAEPNGPVAKIGNSGRGPVAVPS